MSDDLLPDSQWSNAGITLPDGADATYNAGLSPLFLNRTGIIGAVDEYMINRGRSGSTASKITCSSVNIFALLFSGNDITPLQTPEHIYARSLRCLVSTNNR